MLPRERRRRQQQGAIDEKNTKEEVTWVSGADGKPVALL